MSRARVPHSLWVFVTVVIIYWITIALGGRPPDSSRYILAGTVLVLLIAADALDKVSFSFLGIAVAFAMVALAIPPNLAKFYDGRRLQLNDAAASRTEYAMLELEKGRVEAGYNAGSDPKVVEVGGGVYTSLPAGEYFRAADEFGPLGFSLSQVREQPLEFRRAADATLIGALGISLKEASAPAKPATCTAIKDASPEGLVYFPLRPGGILLRSLAADPVEVNVSRFAKDSEGISLGWVEPGAWDLLKIPSDRSPQRWRVLVNGPTSVCSVGL